VSDRGDRLRAWFPTPFVAIVVLLLVLIGLTPNLLSTAAPSAGSLPTEAELVVDRALGDNVTHLYVRGLGLVRYTSIEVAIASQFNWTDPPTLAQISFGAPTWWNNSLASALTTPANPFAVNVTAVFVDAAGARVDFVGAFAFDVAGGVLSEIDYLPPSAGITATPVAQLPLPILLTTVSGGA
jgi:hypothetical protein